MKEYEEEYYDDQEEDFDEVDYLMDKKKRRQKKITISVSTIVVVVLIMVFGFKARTISIEGSSFYSEDKVKQMIFTNPVEENTIGFFLEQTLLGHKNLPFVREYQVNIHWPAEIQIKLYEKTIVAGVDYSGQLIYFDKDGMVLETTTTPRENVPLFVIENVKKFSLYQTLDMGDSNLLQRVLKISNLIEHNKLVIDKIEFNESEDAFLYSGQIKIQLGTMESYEDAMSALKTVLPTAKDNDLKGGIDLSNYKSGDNIILKKS